MLQQLVMHPNLGNAEAYTEEEYRWVVGWVRAMRSHVIGSFTLNEEHYWCAQTFRPENPQLAAWFCKARTGSRNVGFTERDADFAVHMWLDCYQDEEGGLRDYLLLVSYRMSAGELEDIRDDLPNVARLTKLYGATPV